MFETILLTSSLNNKLSEPTIRVFFSSELYFLPWLFVIILIHFFLNACPLKKFLADTKSINLKGLFYTKTILFYYKIINTYNKVLSTYKLRTNTMKWNSLFINV